MLFFSYRVREESPQLGVSRPYKDVHKEARSKGGMSNAHKTQNQSDNTHTSRNKSSQHTQRVHNSNGALIAIAKNQRRGIDVLVLRNVVGMLGVLLHAPRGPFYSPKAARSR